MYKVKNNISPQLMKNIFIQKENAYNLRRQHIWEIRAVKSVFHGTESLSFRGPKTWDILPTDIKKNQNLCGNLSLKLKNGNQWVAPAGYVKFILIIWVSYDSTFLLRYLYRLHWSLDVYSCSSVCHTFEISNKSYLKAIVIILILFVCYQLSHI